MSMLVTQQMLRRLARAWTLKYHSQQVMVHKSYRKQSFSSHLIVRVVYQTNSAKENTQLSQVASSLIPDEWMWIAVSDSGLGFQHSRFKVFETKIH